MISTRYIMKLFLFFVFITFPLFAQVEYSQGVIPAGGNSGFYFDVANYKSDEDGKTRVDVYFQIPYSSLQFVKYQNKFRAKYSFTLTIYDEKKANVIAEKVWNGKILAKSFAEAASDKNSKYGLKTLSLVPNNYTLVGVLYDKDSKKEYTTTAKLKVRKFSKKIELSDILFIDSKIDSQIVLNISNTITSADSALFFYYEIYSDITTELSIEYIIADKNDKPLFNFDKVLSINANITQIKEELRFPKISLGKHKLIVKVLDTTEKTKTSISKYFISKITGFPISITNIDESIEQMEYIATSDEISDMLETKDSKAKLRKFRAFWKKRDPSPSTIDNKIMTEYFRRVAYANTNFKHYTAGWRTDMGMLYILLGPPDNVDRHPFELNSKPYEVWTYYNLNKRFYFVDKTGFGDFCLLNRDYGSWYKYRQ